MTISRIPVVSRRAMLLLGSKLSVTERRHVCTTCVGSEVRRSTSKIVSSGRTVTTVSTSALRLFIQRLFIGLHISERANVSNTGLKRNSHYFARGPRSSQRSSSTCPLNVPSVALWRLHVALNSSISVQPSGKFNTRPNKVVTCSPHAAECIRMWGV
jgi:hypothetical protein